MPGGRVFRPMRRLYLGTLKLFKGPSMEEMAGRLISSIRDLVTAMPMSSFVYERAALSSVIEQCCCRRHPRAPSGARRTPLGRGCRLPRRRDRARRSGSRALLRTAVSAAHRFGGFAALPSTRTGARGRLRGQPGTCAGSHPASPGSAGKVAARRGADRSRSIVLVRFASAEPTALMPVERAQRCSSSARRC